MRRKPYLAGKRMQPAFEALSAPMDLIRSVSSDDWLTAEEAAALLKKFRRKDGKPSVGAIHTMIWRGQLRARKVFGRLLFSRAELDRLIALSPSTGG